jgi:NAD dependent epimerase/dehydratase family enzyme
MKIAITGSTGLVGYGLVPLLTTGGHHVVRIVRALPFGPLGSVAHAWSVKADLEKIFDFREERVSALLGASHSHA